MVVLITESRQPPLDISIAERGIQMVLARARLAMLESVEDLLIPYPGWRPTLQCPALPWANVLNPLRGCQFGFAEKYQFVFFVFYRGHPQKRRRRKKVVKKRQFLVFARGLLAGPPSAFALMLRRDESARQGR